MRRWILAVIMAAGVAGGWTPGGHYPTGEGGVPAAVNDPLSGLVPYSMNVQVTGRISTNDVAVFTDRTGRYLRGTNLVHLLAGLAPAAINAGMSNYLVEVTGVATTAQARAELAVTLAEAATNLTAQAVAALGVQSNLTDTAYVAATNAAAEAVTAYAAATNAAAQAAAAYAAGTNAQATATAVEYLAAAGYAAGTNGQALAWAAGTNASAAAAAAGLAYVAATNAQAEAAAAAFDAALAAADLSTALSAATNAQSYAYTAMTNAAQARAQAAAGYAAGTNALAISATSHTGSTNAAAQAAAVYATATNAQALAQGAAASASIALTLAGSYHSSATNAYATATNAAAQVSAAYTAATNAAAQAAAVYALAASKNRLEGYTGISTNTVWMDLEGLPGCGVTARLWRAYAPTALVWQASCPLLTNKLNDPLAQTRMETQWWGSVPFPLSFPSDGPVTYTQRSSNGALHSFTAVTNVFGGADIYYGNTRASNYLAKASAPQADYLAGEAMTFDWIGDALTAGLTGTVTLARALPGAVTNAAGTLATADWVGTYVFDFVVPLFNEIYDGLWDPFDNHTNNLANPHGVTAAQLGALTNETDTAALAALAAHSAYWPPDATARDFFTFTTNANEITITGYNIDGGTDVVIPDYINGWPVTTIGANAFSESGVTSIGGAGNVVTVGDFAFAYCYALASVPLPQAQTVGASAFGSCYSLTSVSLPQVQTVGYYAFGSCTSLTSVYFNNDAPTIVGDIFADLTPNQVTNYVTNPQATGWGEKLGGMPVVRLPLYADAIYQAGLPVATEAHVAEQIAAIPEPDMSDHPTFSQIAASNALPYTAWTGTVTPADGTATVSIAHGNMPVLVTDAPCVLTLDPTGYGTGGVSRVSLSYYTGTNALTFATNIIKYAETPTVVTNGWNTLLIRRVSDGAWKGVGL
jgi:hypothetical protein